MVEPKKKKNRLTLNNIGLVLLVLVAAALFYVWQARAGAAARVADLSDNVTLVNTQLGALGEPAAGLTDELLAAEKELADTKSGFPNAIERNEVIDYLLDIASDFNIDILPLRSYGWNTVNIGLEYRVLRLSVNAKGTLANVEDFMDALQSGRYPTLAISGCGITRADVSLPGFPTNNMIVNVGMEICIYTLSPSSGEGGAS